MQEDRGSKVGRYEMLGTLGTGGMAIVYRALDPQLNREVAVKLMGAARSTFSDDAVQRFQRELKAMALVTHPNVVRIFDGGEHEGRPFLVTELIEGKTLEQILSARGKVPAARCVELTCELLEALAAVHAAGLVHRDIKPSNLMVRGDSGLVLMDFGIALAAFKETLTRTGDVPGTLQYLPPECLGGKKATAASDLFQVGLVLYEMLVGSALFSFKNPKDFLMAHGDLPPADLAARCPDASESLLAVLRKSLEPEPKQRFQSAHEMLSALRKSDTGEPRRVSRTGIRRASHVAPAAPVELRPASDTGAAGRDRALQLAAVPALLLIVSAACYWLFGLLPPGAPDGFDASITSDALEVTFESSRSRKGLVEVDLGEIGAFVAEESSAARHHRVRIPGSFVGLPLKLRVSCEGGSWSAPRSFGQK
ncbi:MAG: serine/threonine protein kinase [Candidatus Wallbacteria bacterium]|nr:serine/threonine protein kinase [Candidatus Wallbacteria bacterium]